MSLNRSAAAVVGDPANSRAVVGWNGGGVGHVQVVTLSSNQSGTAGESVALGVASSRLLEALAESIAVHRGYTGGAL